MYLKNKPNDGLFEYLILVIVILGITSVSVLFLNIVFASTSPFLLSDMFTSSIDICDDRKDNDGNGFVDDNCGNASLKVIYNESGTISRIESMCHEDCEDD